MAGKKVTYAIAHAIGMDAGNASMRAGGRSKWSRKDANACWAAFEKVRPLANDLDGSSIPGTILL